MPFEEPDFDPDNTIVHLRSAVKSAKSYVKERLKKRIRKLREKLEQDTLEEDQKEEFERKIERYLERKRALKGLRRDHISKFALVNRKTWQELKTTVSFLNNLNLKRLEMMDGREAPDVKKLKRDHEMESNESKMELKEEEIGIQAPEPSDGSNPVFESELKFQRQRLCLGFMKLMEIRGETLTCGMCSKAVVAEKRVQPAMEHVYVHLKKPMFRCKKCAWSGRTYHAVMQHLKQLHEATMPGNFEDDTDNYHAEIIDMIKKIFGKGELEVDAVEISNVKIPVPESGLMLQRRAIIDRFVKLAKDQGGKFNCGLCSKTFGAKTVKMATQHAHSHLKEPLYGCKKCDWTGPTYQSILKHLSERHDATVTGNYEDRTDQFHEMILDIIKKVFGKSK